MSTNGFNNRALLIRCIWNSNTYVLLSGGGCHVIYAYSSSSSCSPRYVHVHWIWESVCRTRWICVRSPDLRWTGKEWIKDGDPDLRSRLKIENRTKYLSVSMLGKSRQKSRLIIDNSISISKTGLVFFFLSKQSNTPNRGNLIWKKYLKKQSESRTKEQVLFIGHISKTRKKDPDTVPPFSFFKKINARPFNFIENLWIFTECGLSSAERNINCARHAHKTAVALSSARARAACEVGPRFSIMLADNVGCR